MNHPTNDLIRMVPLPQADFRSEGDGNTLIGYPVVFNNWTEIRGWEGNFLERIDPVALNKTLVERGDRVKVLFNHGFDPQIGDKPLGKPSVMEVREHGLYTETPLADTSYNKDIRELLRVGAIDGMSFRFNVIKDDWDEKPEPSDDNPRGLPLRTVKELRLAEFGPVTFPAYEATTVGVRSIQTYVQYRDGLYAPEALVELTEPVTADHSAEGDTRSSRFKHSSASKALYVRKARESEQDKRNTNYPKR